MKYNYLKYIGYLLVLCLSACGGDSQIASAGARDQNSQFDSAAMGEAQFNFEAASQTPADTLGFIAAPVSGLALIAPIPAPTPNVTSYFSFSTLSAAYYVYLDSLDFDLGITYANGPYKYLNCRVRFPIIQPATAQLTNADGIDATGAPYIDYGSVTFALNNIAKSRRVEMSTGGTGTVNFSVEVTCGIQSSGSTSGSNRPLITQVVPSVKSLGDRFIIHGLNFKPGATVKFDNISSGAVITPTQITTRVPMGVNLKSTLTVTNPVSGSSGGNQDVMSTFRTDAIVEQHLLQTGPGPSTGTLVTGFYNLNDINGTTGCPGNLPFFYQLTPNFDISSGTAINELARVSSGAYLILSWIDPAFNGVIKPKAGNARVANPSNFLPVPPQMRAISNETFVDVYPTDCP